MVFILQFVIADDEFTIYVANGNHDKADTEAEIFCELVGDWGSSGKIMLTHSNNSVMFKKGQVGTENYKLILAHWYNEQKRLSFSSCV